MIGDRQEEEIELTICSLERTVQTGFCGFNRDDIRKTMKRMKLYQIGEGVVWRVIKIIQYLSFTLAI